MTDEPLFLRAVIGREGLAVAEVHREMTVARQDVLKTPEPGFFVTGVADGLLQLRRVAHTPDSAKKFKIETKLREQLLPALQKAGIEIPRLQRMVPIGDASQAPQTR